MAVSKQPGDLAARHHQRARDHPRRHQQLYGVTFDPSCIAAGQQALPHSAPAPPAHALQCFDATSPSSARSPTLGRRHCIVFSTGYQANLGMIAGLASRRTPSISTPTAFSIYDGCTCRALSSSASATMIPRSRSPPCPRRSTKVAAWWCSRASTRWSATGRTPAEFIDRAPRGQLLVDEAHSFGVLGPWPRPCRGGRPRGGMRFHCRHLLQEHRLPLAASAPATTDVRAAALRHAALHVHCLIVACQHRHLAPGPARPQGEAGIARAHRCQFRAAVQRLPGAWSGHRCGVPAGRRRPLPRRDVPLRHVEPASRPCVYVNMAIPPSTPGGLCLLRCVGLAAHPPTTSTRSSRCSVRWWCRRAAWSTVDLGSRQ